MFVKGRMRKGIGEAIGRPSRPQVVAVAICCFVLFQVQPILAEEGMPKHWMVEIETADPETASMLMETYDVLETRGEGGGLLGYRPGT